MNPQRGETVVVGPEASVQFPEPFNFTIITCYENTSTPHGWVWMTGYVLDDGGDAVHRRELFVQTAGLRLARRRPDPCARKGANRGAVRGAGGGRRTAVQRNAAP